MIDLAHGISRHDRAMRRGEWQPQRGVDMWRATLGIVGLGRIVSALLVNCWSTLCCAGATPNGVQCSTAGTRRNFTMVPQQDAPEATATLVACMQAEFLGVPISVDRPTKRRLGRRGIAVTNSPKGICDSPTLVT
jgi:hypothetical protein